MTSVPFSVSGIKWLPPVRLRSMFRDRRPHILSRASPYSRRIRMLRSTLTFLAGAVCALATAGDRAPSTAAAVKALESDRTAIERLHQADMAATLTGDPADLEKLWTADAVRLQPDEPAEVGRAAIRATDERSKARSRDGRVLSYVPEIKDLQIKDGWA